MAKCNALLLICFTAFFTLSAVMSNYMYNASIYINNNNFAFLADERVDTNTNNHIKFVRSASSYITIRYK